MHRSITAIIVLSLGSTHLGAADDELLAGQLAQRDLYTRQIRTLELERGHFDRTLVEPLVQQAQLSMALNDFEQANTSLERAVQVLRMSDGLYTPAQFPLLNLQVENDVRRGNWVAANGHLEHLYWLYVNKHRGIDDALIGELRALSAFHLEAVATDDPAQQAYHFREAARISTVTLRAATYLWGEHDVRLAELNYELVKQFYLQAVAVDRGTRTGYELREVAPGSSWIRSRQTAMRAYYQSGMRLLRQTRALYEEQNPPDQEGVAMADIYIADWQILFTRDDAVETYERAHGRLLAAGVDHSALETFFCHPQILPQSQFHASVASALTARQSAPSSMSSQFPDSDVALRFSEWSGAFPDVPFPFPQARFRFQDEQQWGSAVLSFTLSGMEKVSRWVNGRYVTRLSVPDRLEVISQDPASAMEAGSFAEKLHYLHFRPRLVAGVPETAQGTLEYQFTGR